MRRVQAISLAISSGLAALAVSVCLSSARADGLAATGVVFQPIGTGGGASAVAEFVMLVPSNPVDCERENPWHAGQWPLLDGGSVPSGACMALRLTLRHSSHVYLIHEGSGSVLTRLWPSGCGRQSLAPSDAGQYRYPPPREGRERIIALDGDAGEERFHLIVFKHAAESSELLRSIAALATLAGSCQSEMLPSASASLLAGLKAAAADGTVFWSSQTINHY